MRRSRNNPIGAKTEAARHQYGEAYVNLLYEWPGHAGLATAPGIESIGDLGRQLHYAGGVPGHTEAGAQMGTRIDEQDRRRVIDKIAPPGIGRPGKMHYSHLLSKAGDLFLVSPKSDDIGFGRGEKAA